jgi:hypothetical protein
LGGSEINRPALGLSNGKGKVLAANAQSSASLKGANGAQKDDKGKNSPHEKSLTCNPVLGE